MAKQVVVGRKGNQPFAISDKGVSGKHLRITLQADGNALVEDLESTNGTFIDGLRIVKKVVPVSTVVRLGSSFSFKISDALAQPTNDGNQDAAYLERFAALEEVWNKYQADKIALQKKNASKGFLRMMPLFLLGALGYVISLIPSLADYRTLITISGLALGVIITWISYQSATNLPEQMEKLNQQFQIDYVCPKCKQFLGFTPFEAVKNKRQCSNSKCNLRWGD